jgi:RNA polymerase sigma-70 factor (ECF subfamily)
MAIEKSVLGDLTVEGSEDKLIIRAREGDPAAWEVLVRTYQEHIFRLAYLTLQDPAEAEDVAQETFLRAFMALDRFELGRPVRPWLTRIAINLARNRRRSLGRYWKQLRGVLANEPQPERDNAGLEDRFQARWTADTLRSAMQRLGQDKREAVYLRFFLAMPEAEMAEALNVRPGTIKSRLHRAMIDLRRLIEDDYPDLQELFEEA